MWFEADYHNECESLLGRLFYDVKEESLYCEPFQQSGFSIMLGAAYTCLDVNYQTGEIVQLSGLNPQRLWKKRSLQMPPASKGKLFFRSDMPLQKGAGVDYQTAWNTYYDRRNSCICIGTPNLCKGLKFVEFSGGVVAVLNAQDLYAIWAEVEIN